MFIRRRSLRDMIFRERSTVYLGTLPACSLDMTHCEDQYRGDMPWGEIRGCIFNSG